MDPSPCQQPHSLISKCLEPPSGYVGTDTCASTEDGALAIEAVALAPRYVSDRFGLADPFEDCPVPDVGVVQYWCTFGLPPVQTGLVTRGNVGLSTGIIATGKLPAVSPDSGRAMDALGPIPQATQAMLPTLIVLHGTCLRSSVLWSSILWARGPSETAVVTDGMTRKDPKDISQIAHL